MEYISTNFMYHIANAFYPAYFNAEITQLPPPPTPS